MKSIVNKIIPFLFAGIAMVAFAFGIILLSYLFFFGAVVGFVLFFISWVRNKFFAQKKMPVPKKPAGRIIDSDDWRKH